MTPAPRDKLLHFAAGSAIVLLIGFGALACGLSLALGLTIALVVCVVVAFGKEVYDARYPELHDSEEMDFIATIAGGAWGALAVVAWLAVIEALWR